MLANAELLEAPLDLTYDPQPKQAAWHACPAYESGFGGAKFGGKSFALLFEALRYKDHPRYRGIIFRRTYKRLDEIIDRAQQWLPGFGARWNGAEHVWRFPSGARLYLSHCQYEESKYDHHGHEYQFIGFDQLEEFSETQYQFLLAQNRTGVAELAPYTRSTFNPGGTGHAWVKRRFVTHGTRTCAPWWATNEKRQITGSRCFHFANIDDNPIGDNADPSYRQRLDDLPEAERRALKEGDWDVFSGQYFSEWRRPTHTCAPFTIPAAWTRRIVSVDFGYGAPWSCHFYVQDLDLWRSEHITRWYAYHELYERHVADEDQGKRIRALMEADVAAAKTKLGFQVIADPSMWNRKPDGHSIAEVYAAQGVPMIPANNDRVQGWQRLREYLALQADQKPALIYFNPTCKHAIETIPALVYDTTRVEDLDTEGEDHAADDARYFTQGVGPIPHAAAPSSPVVRHVRHG